MSLWKPPKVFIMVWYHLLIKKLLIQNPTVLESVGKREENLTRQTLTTRRMGDLTSAVNDTQIAQREYKTCMIHGTGNSSKEFKVLRGFGTKHDADQPTKDRGRNPVPQKIFQKKQENHAIINNVVDEILMNEQKK